MKQNDTMKITGSALLAWVVIALLVNNSAVHAEPTVDRMEWFRDAKFGMFIHFGASERGRGQNDDRTRTQRYEAAVRAFNPVDFDARQWLRIAKEGGAKYIVFTTKHHDGFCKWDSALTDWDVMDQTPFKRDIVGELSEACQATGIRLGCYYSIADWHHPEYDAKYSNRNGFHYSPNPDADITKYIEYMHGQVEELCVKYQPSLFWFDGSRGFRAPDRKPLLRRPELLDLMHSHGAICNSRLGDDDGLRYVDYLSMGDNQAPPGNIGVHFETAGTMNGSWHFSAPEEDYQSVEELLERLVTVVGKGGNYLLNVGPDAKGVIPEFAVTRLKTIGHWLEKNGEAIYGTKAGPYPHGLNWGSITQRKVGEDTTLYLNVVDWPAGGRFRLYGLDNKILNASLLASGESLAHSSAIDETAGVKVHTITVPAAAPDPYVSVIALTVKGAASMEQAHLQQSDGCVDLDGYTAIIHDKKVLPNKPRRAVDFKMFTVPLGGEGIIPARMLSVGGFNEVGQALSWDFRLVEPGTYEVAVVSIGNPSRAGRMRATVAGQSVANSLHVRERTKTVELPSRIQESLSVLGTVTIAAPGMQTLTLEVASDFAGSAPRIRGVKLLPVAGEK